MRKLPCVAVEGQRQRIHVVRQLHTVVQLIERDRRRQVQPCCGKLPDVVAHQRSNDHARSVLPGRVDRGEHVVIAVPDDDGLHLRGGRGREESGADRSCGTTEGPRPEGEDQRDCRGGIGALIGRCRRILACRRRLRGGQCAEPDRKRNRNRDAAAPRE
jgi:hypothetical protein